MSRIISLAELRAIGANTFADIRRDEKLARERRAIAARGLPNEMRLARWQAERASETCIRVARKCRSASNG